MNLLMVGLDLNPPWIEGIRNTARDLSLRLLERGYKVHFLTKGYKYHKEIEHIKPGIIFHRILTMEHSGYLRGFQYFFSMLPFKILKVVKEYKIDIIHAHSSYPFFGWYVGLSAALANSKKVFSLYSCSNALPAFEYPLSLRYALRLAKSYKPLKLKSIDEIIVSSWKAYNDLIKAGFTPKNLHHISVGIDTNRFKPKRIDETRIRNYLKIPKEAKVILFAGDLAPYKGVEIFLYSLKKLRNRSMNIVGLILTKGLYERELQRRRLIENIVKQLDIRDNIRLLGVRNDIDVIYNLSDVVVFPFLRGYSLMDVPRALLEAMACGRPVVATKVGAIPEVIRHGENGILIEPNNELALEEAIVLLLQNEGEAERLGENASRCIVEKHELNKIIDELEHVYKNS